MRNLIFTLSLLLFPAFSCATDHQTFKDDANVVRAMRVAVPGDQELDNTQPSTCTSVTQMAKTVTMQLGNLGAMAYVIEGRYTEILKYGSPLEKGVLIPTVFSGVVLALQLAKYNLDYHYDKAQQPSLPRVLPVFMGIMVILKIFCV